jgi:hypothetical protein
MKSYQVAEDLAQWRPLLQWLDSPRGVIVPAAVTVATQADESERNAEPALA